jgi:hypothetical protein
VTQTDPKPPVPRCCGADMAPTHIRIGQGPEYRVSSTVHRCGRCRAEVAVPYRWEERK